MGRPEHTYIRIYRLPQKYLQIYTVIAYICIWKVAWFAVYICDNIWNTLYVSKYATWIIEHQTISLWLSYVPIIVSLQGHGGEGLVCVEFKYHIRIVDLGVDMWNGSGSDPRLITGSSPGVENSVWDLILISGSGSRYRCAAMNYFQRKLEMHCPHKSYMWVCYEKLERLHGHTVWNNTFWSPSP